MIDVMTRLKVHHLSEGGAKQAAIAEKVGISLRSVERILNEEEPPTRDEVVRDGRVAGKRIGRRPKASPEIIEQIRLLLAAPEHRRITAIEVLRRAKEWGFTGGRSQMTELVRSLRPEVANEPVVRFEGLPGEYAQFDFGECEVMTAAGLVTVELLNPSPDPTLNIVSIQDGPGGSVFLTFVGIPGLNYDIQAKEVLDEGVPWVTLAQRTAGPNGHFTFTDVPPTPVRFYRAVGP